MPVRRWKFRIRHILDAMRKIQSYTAGMTCDRFSTDPKTIDAVVRNFAVIGEAVRHVPVEAQSNSPDIPWDKMRAMRNVIVHEYDQVSPPTMWETLRNDLPPLIARLEELLKNLPDNV